jgi:autotransporter-associated beta strand protein
MRTVCFVSFIAVVLVTSFAPATDTTWNVVSGDWSTASNWTNGVPSGFPYNAYIQNGGSATISKSNAITNILYVGNTTGSGDVEQNTGALSTQGENIGYAGSGSYNQSGGSNAAYGFPNNGLSLGSSPGAVGTYNFSGTAYMRDSSERVGDFGTGVFMQSGGTNVVTEGDVDIGYELSSSGTYSLMNGLLSAGQEVVGYFGTGTFVQSGGTNASNYEIFLGGEGASQGTYSLSGGLISASPNEAIGYSGTGVFTQSGGTNNVNTMYLGTFAGSNGTYVLKGLSQLSAGTECVGSYNGTGVFSQSGGVNTVTSLSIASQSGSGTYNLNGGLLVVSSISNGPGLSIFNFSGGTLQASDGFSTSQPMTLGTSGGGATFDTAGDAMTLAGPLSGLGGLTKVNGGTLTLAAGNSYIGTTTINAGILSLANSAALAGGGNITFAGGTLQFTASNSQDYSGRIVGSTGRISIDTNGVNVMFTSILASSNTGGLTKIGNGTLTLAAANTFSGTTLVSGGTLALASPPALQDSTLDTRGSGVLSLGSLTSLTLGGLTGSGTFNLANSASEALALTAGNNNVNTTFSGVLTGPGSLTKIGSGIFTLSGPNNYLGNTTLSGGTVEIASGQMPAANEYVGAGGAAALVQSGGTNAVSVAGALYIGNATTDNGTYVLSGGLVTAPFEFIGNAGSGSFTQSGGTNSVSFDLIVGNGPSGNGEYSLAGNSLLESPLEYIGNLGSGGLTQSGGTNSVAFDLIVGNSPGGNGGYILGGGLLTAPSEYIGSAGAGSFTQSGGTNAVGSLVLAASAGSTGTYTLNGGLLSLSSLTQGAGSAVFNFSGGTFRVVSSFSTSVPMAFPAAGNNGVFDTNGNSLTLAGPLSGSGGLRVVGTGTLVLAVSNGFTGTTLVSSGTLLLGDPNALSGSTFDTSGSGLLGFGGLTNANFGGLQGSGSLSLNNASLVAVALTVGGNNASTSFSGILNGSGGLTKVGNGTLTLLGSNSYACATSINAGILSLANSAALPAGGNISFGGGTLQYTNSNTVDYSADIINSIRPISIDTNGTNATFASSLTSSNSAGLTKLGTGTLTLLASNAFTGYTTITGGTLQVGNGGCGASIGSTSGVTNNGSLIFNHGDTVNFKQIISGSGNLTQTGTGTLILANSDSFTGTTTIDGGTLQIAYGGSLGATSYEYVGYSGMGTFMQSGGINTCANNLCLGCNRGSTGNYYLSGGQLSLPNPTTIADLGLYVGFSGTGTFTQSGGTNSVSGYILLGCDSTGRGTYNLSDSGVVSVGNWEGIGCAGTGSFTQAGGTNSCEEMIIAWNSGSHGNYSLTAGSLSVAQTSSGIWVGYAGTGNFTQSGGTNACGYLAIGGDWSPGVGTYSLSGSGVLSALSEILGYCGTGTFTQSGGTNAVGNSLCLGNFGYGSYSSGTYSLSGSGLLSVSGTGECIGNLGAGTFTQTGGTNTTSALCLACSNGGSGRYILNGGLLILSSLSEGSGTAAFGFSGGTLQASSGFSASLPMTFGTSGGGATFDTGGYTVTLGGALSGPGGLMKVGSGALFLSGTNTYTGGTTIAAGTLVFASSQAIGGSGANVTANYGATAAAGYPIDQNFLNRLTPSSSGVAALAADSGNALNFARFANLRLGATGTANYSGILTPSGTTYLLGGGGGVLTVSGPLNGANSLDVDTNGTPAGTVIIPGPTSYTGTTQVSDGTLVLEGPNASSSFTAGNGGTLLVSGATLNLNWSSARAAAGGIVAYQNATINGGYLRGPGTHSVLPGGTSYFNGVTTYNSTAFQQNGPAVFTNFTNGGQLANNGAMTWDGGMNTASGQFAVNSLANIDDWTNDGLLTVNSGGTLNNSQSDLVSGGGSQITINQGGQLNTNSDGSGSALDLHGSLLVNNGTITGTTNVYYGSTVQGTGVFGPINLFDGGTLAISPSAGPFASSLIVSGGSITGAGQFAVSATIHDATLVAPTPADLLVLSGNMSGDGSITKLGAGTVVLSAGSNTFTGGTNVEAGTLIVTNSEAIPNGTSVTVGAGASLIFGASNAPAAVPEPSTFVLLSIGAVSLAGYAWRRRRT